jgi:hypothetical protein
LMVIFSSAIGEMTIVLFYKNIEKKGTYDI